MADQLTQVMRDRADTMPFELDAEVVLAAGRRRVLRRRLAVGAAGVTAGCLALLGIAVVGQDTDRALPPVATQSMESGSFAMGGLMRRDGRDLVMSSSVTSYVRVPGGNVFTTGDGTVRLLPARRLDAVTIGRTSAVSPRLVADPVHDRVAWVSASAGAATFVVHDVATGADRVAFAETGRGGTGPEQRPFAARRGTHRVPEHLAHPGPGGPPHLPLRARRAPPPARPRRGLREHP